MAKKPADVTTPLRDFHPFRMSFDLTEPVVTGGTIVFDDPSGDVPHAGASQILKLDGVHTVSLATSTVKVLVDPGTNTAALLPQVQDALRAGFIGQSPFDASPPADEPEASDEAPADDSVA